MIPEQFHPKGLEMAFSFKRGNNGPKRLEMDQKVKMAIILPTGQWYAPSAVITDAWYCMVLHGIALYCMVLHGIA